MNAHLALIKRELLEHRGAFLYAPAALLAALFAMLILSLVFGETEFTHITRGDVTIDWRETGVDLYYIGLAAIFAMWSGYLMIALFFYYADSFSADRRNNSMLFWKSMPQSDLKILTSKALAGITIFPLLIFIFAVITGFLIYPFSFLVAMRIPIIPLINPAEMLGAWVQMALVGAVYFVLTILWYAPFLAWVAGLSTLVQRWSIPLAFLIPGALVLVEKVTSYGRGGSQPIAEYLGYRADGILEDSDIFKQVFRDGSFTPFDLLSEMLTRTDWTQMLFGLLFAIVAVYLASEYRRRRLEAS